MSTVRALTAKSWPKPDKGHCRMCGNQVPRGSRTLCSVKCGQLSDFLCRWDFQCNEVRRTQPKKCAICGNERCFLEVDHIVPVVEGGGPEITSTKEDVLKNLRLLCQPCHRKETAALRQRLRAKRLALLASTGMLLLLLSGCGSPCRLEDNDILLKGQVWKGQQSERGVELPAPNEASIKVERQYVHPDFWPEAWKRVPIDRLTREQEQEFSAGMLP